MTTPQDDEGPSQTPPQEEYMAMMREANSPETKERNLRDWFAGMALQGTIQPHGAGEGGYRRVLAANCYATADAMLAARKEVA